MRLMQLGFTVTTSLTLLNSSTDFLPNNITPDSAALAPSQFVMKIRFYFCCFSLQMMPLKKKKKG